MESLPTLRDIDEEIIQSMQIFRDQLGIQCMLSPDVCLKIILTEYLQLHTSARHSVQ